MKRDSNKVVKSVDGTDHMEIGAKVHKDDVTDASYWSMVTAIINRL